MVTIRRIKALTELYQIDKIESILIFNANIYCLANLCIYCIVLYDI